jgi:hypothetical protein
MFGAATITLSHKDAQKAQRDPIKTNLCFLCLLWLLLTWCLNVYVDLLRSSASEYSSSKHEQPNQYDEHKNHHNRDNTHAAAAATFVGHERLPPCFKTRLTGGLS